MLDSFYMKETSLFKRRHALVGAELHEESFRAHADVTQHLATHASSTARVAWAEQGCMLDSRDSKIEAARDSVQLSPASFPSASLPARHSSLQHAAAAADAQRASDAGRAIHSPARRIQFSTSTIEAVQQREMPQVQARTCTTSAEFGLVHVESVKRDGGTGSAEQRMEDGEALGEGC